jgi:hypothetical protein
VLCVLVGWMLLITLFKRECAVRFNWLGAAHHVVQEGMWCAL